VALEKRHQTVVQVGQNAFGIDAGASEIRSAADELAKRQNNRQETAAAPEKKLRQR